MVTAETFHHSLADAAPPKEASLALRALWWAAKGDWDRAHGYAQRQDGGRDCDKVHAYLHRQEGDMGNAGYWYRRAGRSVPVCTLEEEWRGLVVEMLAGA
jgi:hypothetical protein